MWKHGQMDDGSIIISKSLFYWDRPELTGRLGGEAEGVEAIAALILRPVTANAGEQLPSAGGPRANDGVMDAPVPEPAGVAPVQTLRPRCNEDTRAGLKRADGPAENSWPGCTAYLCTAGRTRPRRHLAQHTPPSPRGRWICSGRFYSGRGTPRLQVEDISLCLCFHICSVLHQRPDSQPWSPGGLGTLDVGTFKPVVSKILLKFTKWKWFLYIFYHFHLVKWSKNV